MIKFMAVTPHGDELLMPKDAESEKLSNAMKALAEVRDKVEIDTWVAVTPHNVRISDHFAVLTSENFQGEIDRKKVTVKNDLELAHAIASKARSLALPVVEVNFGALEGPQSVIPLDWGTTIPLSFLYRGEKLVIVGPARQIGRSELLSFGRALGEECSRIERSIGVLISADNAHTHRADGPYGFSQAAKVYDELVIRAFKERDLSMIAEANDDLIDAAKPDSFWQFMVMLGILQVVPMEPVFLAYGLPSYYGMLVAYFKLHKKNPA
ncbi:MAG: extradiol dioxygenase [Thermoprotei archaeon]